jgi:two-component system, NarL family, sensor histidine kinase DesK
VVGETGRVVTRLIALPRPTPLGLATAGVVAGNIGLPTVELARIGAGWTPSPGHAVEALVATACYLPFHVRHVWYAVRGARPPGGGWTLVVMVAVVVGALPVIGTSWLIACSPLVVSVLVVVRPPWSLPAAAAVGAAPVTITYAAGAAEWAPYYTAAVIWQGASLFVLVRLVGVAGRLHAARLALAAEAVARERLRIDEELQRTLGAALAAILDTGGRAGRLAHTDPAGAAEALKSLVDGSRAALAQARRTVSQFQDVALRAELRAAIANLLRDGPAGRSLVVTDRPGTNRGGVG